LAPQAQQSIARSFLVRKKNCRNMETTYFGNVKLQISKQHKNICNRPGIH
jgi:hypothetical protein